MARFAPAAARDSAEPFSALEKGRTLAINVRAIAREEVGSRSEKLVEFGVAPLRPRTRKRRPPQGPDEITPAV